VNERNEPPAQRSQPTDRRQLRGMDSTSVASPTLGHGRRQSVRFSLRTHEQIAFHPDSLPLRISSARRDRRSGRAGARHPRRPPAPGDRHAGDDGSFPILRQAGSPASRIRRSPRRHRAHAGQTSDRACAVYFGDERKSGSAPGERPKRRRLIERMTGPSERQRTRI